VKVFINNIVLFPKTFVEYFEHKMTLQKEISILRRENIALKAKIINTKNLENENKMLREASNFKYELSSFKALEKVIGISHGLDSYQVLISAKNENVKQGAIAISSDGLVGIVINISRGIATVLPTTSERFSVSVKSESGKRLILSGDGQMLQAVAIREETGLQVSVNVGDMLYTSGDCGIFPEGIPVAVVQEASQVRIAAEPVSDIEKISYLWIVDHVQK
jgi:rod shape-determining protein MreC